MNDDENGGVIEMAATAEAKKTNVKAAGGKRTASQLPESERALILQEYSSGAAAKELAAKYSLKTPLIVYNLAQKAGIGSGTRKGGRKRGPGRPKGSKNRVPKPGPAIKFRQLTELEMVRMENRVLRAALDQIPGANDLLRRVSRG